MKAAVVQLTSTDDLGHNLSRTAQWVERAAQAGAELVALPENFAYLREDESGPHPIAQDLSGEIAQFLRDQAKRHAIVLAGGTLAEAITGDERTYNTSLVIEADGSVRAVYRKIHLFDVTLAEAQLRESLSTRPGDEIVVAATRAGILGLSICYDVRFPELYRELSARGAQILLIPAAFTVPTGRDHWELLVRARAVENQAFVLAAAQYGVHNRRRASYGRSMIVDAWGTVLATVPDGEGVAVADLDFARLEEIRERMPALRHRRLPL